MSTPSDLGYDPIIPHIHDTFMDHFPSGPVNLLDPSRTSPMKTSKTFLNSRIGLSLYESYSPDHSGSPRDILDPIRDSEEHSVSYSSFHNYSITSNPYVCLPTVRKLCGHDRDTSPINNQ